MSDPNLEQFFSKEEAMSFRAFRRDIFNSLAQRGWNYWWFLKALELYALISRKRGTFVTYYYVFFRFIDDVVDGDRQLPAVHVDKVEFLKTRIATFIGQHKSHSGEFIDCFLSFCLCLGSRFDANFSEETEDILRSLMFDANRVQRFTVFSHEELEHHFFLLDVRGCIRAVLKVLGEQEDYWRVFEPLGRASRIYYNLRDYKEDISRGLVNISNEDCKTFHISEQSWYDTDAPEVQTWFVSQAHRGDQLIHEYRERVHGLPLKRVTRVAADVLFERSASTFFDKILNRN